MTKHTLYKKIGAITLASVLALSGLTGCGSNTASTGESTSESSATTTTDEDLVITPLSITYSEKDTDSSYDKSNSVLVTLNGTSIQVEGDSNSATGINGSVLTISKAGTYIISGTLTDGQILVNAPENADVRIVLDQADITSKTSAAIYAVQADNLIITLAPGTTNSVKDGGTNFVYTQTADEEPDAAIFAKCDLTINGTGALTVQADFNNGIGTKDDLVLTEADLTVNAVGDALRGRDSVTVLSGEYTLTAGSDGIQSNNDEDTTKGFVSIEDGTFNIQSAYDGIQAETALSITGGTFDILCTTKTSAVDSAESYKSIKSKTDLQISGGTFTLESPEDTIHSNTNILITDGTFTIKSGDDGIHADAKVQINGGTIGIQESYEGIEGAHIKITDGIFTIQADDDGINAAGGSESGATDRGHAEGAAGDYSVLITGGQVTLTAGCDGIDSNGTVTISGGSVISLINSNEGGSGAIDCDGTFTATGGTIIYGGTTTGNAPDGNSTQSYVYLGTKVTAGQAVSVQKDGKTLISFEPLIDAAYVAFSSPDIVSGESYEVYAGDTLLETITAGSGGGMGMGQGGDRQGGGKPDGGMKQDRNAEQ